MEHSQRSLMGRLRKATEAYHEGYDETRSDRKLGILSGWHTPSAKLQFVDKISKKNRSYELWF